MNWQPVTSRAPQKSMVGSVLFSICINSVDCRAEGSLTMFAGDGERHFSARRKKHHTERA